MKKVALITGASRGLGARLAVEFARDGYRMAINYHTHRAAAESVTNSIGRGGGEAICVRADVRVARDVEAMVSAVLTKWGRLDVLVNNAGIAHESLLLSTSEEQWDRVMDINLKGAFLCTRAAARRMMRQRSGHIINICSILGVWGGRGESAYATSKAALIGFTRSAARELGRYAICVNAVIPGFMMTGMGRICSEAARERARGMNVLTRLSDIGTAARVIVHLAGTTSVSGQLFNCDGRIYRWA